MRSLLVLLLLAPTAHPAQLYRCVGGDGGVSYQSHACARHQRLTRTIHYVPQPDPPARLPARYGRLAASGVSPRSRDVQRRGRRHASVADACAKARQKRHVALERLGLRRTFDDLSRLDAMVREACGGY